MNLRALLTVAALCTAVSGPALADPREDLLQAMNKCAGMADDRNRLACYDALKPQLQAALAAPPPVASKDDSGWFGNLFGSDGGHNDQPQTQPGQFGSERLPAAEQAKVNPPPEQPKVQEIDTITAAVTDYALTPSGRFIVFLDNDQVWQQIEGDTYSAHFKKSGNTVTITRALFGSYALKLNDLNQIFKVKRVK